MKTERRHELQTNILADWIGRHLQQTQGHGKTILAVILLVVAGSIVAAILAKDRAAQSQASWNQFFVAFGQRDPEALEFMAKQNAGTTAGVWAQLAEADLKLAQGIGDLYRNRNNAKANLEEAEQNYLAVAQPTTDQLLRARAWFGLGQVYESTSQLDKAKEYYGKLASSAPDSALGKEAARRAETLSDPETVKWYNWFANQTPQPPTFQGLPGGGLSEGLGLPDLPSDLQNLSDRPDLSLPNFPSVTPDAEPAAGDDDASEAGPDLNSPATEKDAAEGTDSSESKAEEAAAETPKKPAVEESSAAPPESDDDSSE
jgi:tetratricopeptide (TPR) repeat protein